MASFLGIPVFVLTVFVDVVARITRLPVVYEALLDWGRFLASRGVPDGQRPPSRVVPARGAFLWPLLDGVKQSFPLVGPLRRGVSLVPHPVCGALGSSRARACCTVT